MPYDTSRLLPRLSPNMNRLSVCLTYVAMFAVLGGMINLYGYYSIYSPSIKTHYYQMLAKGFLSGHTYLAGAPMDKSSAWHDISYYKGRYYLYFGPIPALCVWIPVKLMTGLEINDAEMTLILASIGSCCLCLLVYLVASGQGWINALGLCLVFLAINFGTWVPFILRRPTIYEVAITGAYCFTAMGLLFSWIYLTNKEKHRWVMLASLCFGFAAGSRITHIFNIVFLIMIFLYLLCGNEKHRFSKLVLRIIYIFGPHLLCLIGLALYNYERFGDAFELGQHYQIGEPFNPYFRFFRYGVIRLHAYKYLLKPLLMRHSLVFPFFILQWGGMYGESEPLYGLWRNSPFSLLFLFWLWDWRALKNWRPEIRIMIGGLIAFALLELMVISAYYFATQRYAIDFAPWMMSVAAIYYLQILKRYRHTYYYVPLLFFGGISALYGTFTGLMAGYCGYLHSC